MVHFKRINIIKSKHSIDFISNLLTYLILIIFFANCLFSYFFVSNMKLQNEKEISNTLDIYTESLSKDISSVEQYAYLILLHDTNLDTYSSKPSYTESIEALDHLRSQTREFEKLNRLNFNLFVSISSSDLVNISSLYMPYEDYLILKEKLLNPQNPESIKFGHWNKITSNKTLYLYQPLKYKTKTIYAILSVQSLITPLNNINIGKKGYITIEKPQVSSSSLFLDNIVTTSMKNTHLPFDIYISIDYYDAFKALIIPQLSLLFLSLLISLITLATLFYINKKIIFPTKRLLRHIHSADNNNTLKKEGIIEIDDANHYINHLFTEIQILKNNIFDSQLKQKRIEMNYLKTQVRPHFYLNILSMIHGMLQTQHYKEIEQLTLSTSKYFRYLFQTNQDTVQLTEEIKHIEDYLMIQHLRYPNTFSYTLNLDSELNNVYIPPLILQTFIENIFKHCFSMDEFLKINISATMLIDTQDYYRVTITDNGPGFPEEVLTKLKKHHSLISSDGRHIGLTNLFERLDLLYGKNYSLQFKNLNHGSQIKLVLPLVTPDKNGENYEYFNS